MTITEFLLARIAEDEDREARTYQTNSRLLDGYEVSTDSIAPDRVTLKPVSGGLPTVMTAREFRERFETPAPDKRVLAECAAKRAIVEQHREFLYTDDEPGFSMVMWDCMCQRLTGKPCPTIGALAAVYADHPDYQERWAL